MSDFLSRRGILRGLATLPLIGGGVTLIGQPTASAEPLSHTMLTTYHTWLHFEERLLSWELARRYSDETYKYGAYHGNPGADFHDAEYNTQGIEHATKRAALVLSTVGCDWKGGRNA